MLDDDAIRALSALANPHRLALFRRLVRAGSEGMCAGDLARAVDLPSSTLTFHLKELERSGLITARREGRFIRQRLNAETMRALIGFLTEDCCDGKPELCGVPPRGEATCC